jgi:ABC-2 type transport system ATP-binding protein
MSLVINSPGNVILEIKDLTKVYHDKTKTVHALNGINLSIQEGEILALLGVNGAGKTTLSSILVTLNPPTSGDILYKGQSIYANLSQYRHILGFCPQRPNLDYDLTVEENLFFAGRYYLIPDDVLRERITQLLSQFELTKYASFNVRSLSGGYKQRLLIARALVHSPHIVIMDEPTVALDPNIRRQLWDKIKELKQLGITVILTTHYLEEAEILSDRVCILDAGNILLIDTSDNLKAKFNMPDLEEVFLHLTHEEAAN